MNVLITGATGNVGLETIRFLLAKKSDSDTVFAAVRDVGRDSAKIPTGAQVREFDFEKPVTLAKALSGIDKLLLIRPPQISDVKQYLFPVIDEAKKQGVRQIVFLSLLGIQYNFLAPHFKVEKYLRRSGIPYVFLRASFFMQNLNTTHQADIRDYNQLLLPAGNGRTSFIDVRDIAEVAAQGLLSPPTTNQAYDLTGAIALTYHEVAGILSQVLGRTITYRPASIGEFRKQYKKQGFANDFINVMIGIYLVARIGLAKKVTPETAQLLGKAPISFRQYVEDYKSWWAK